MIVYRIRRKSDGLYLLSIGNTAQGRWHPKGKLYDSKRDAKIALTHFINRLDGTLLYYERKKPCWELSTVLDEPKIHQAVQEEKQAILDDLEVVEYPLQEIGRAISIDEFRNSS